MNTESFKRYSLGALGFILIIAAWWIVAETAFRKSGVIPSPPSLIAQLTEDGFAYYLRQISVTLASAGQGLVWGVSLALILSTAVMLLPRLAPPVSQFAVFVECAPAVAVGPVVLAVAGGRTPSIFLAAMAVFFTTLLGALLGARAVRDVELELVHVYGGKRWDTFRKVRLPAALPSAFTSLQIAIPAAILGVLIGEYLGGVDSGIGVALSVAQRSVQVERTWIFGLSAALITTCGYVSVLGASRVFLPWSTTSKVGSP